MRKDSIIDSINTDPILVSVIILTYNQENTIEQTLNSIIQQKTSFSYEIIIGEDFSKDNTRQVCLEFIKNHSQFNIRILPQDKNLGLIKNYLNCVKHTKGELIAQCAGDDYWIDELKLQKQVNKFFEDEEIGLVFTNFKILNTTTSDFEFFDILESSNINFENLLLNNFIGALTVMFKKKLFEEAKDDKIFEQNFLMEDYPLWLYISKFSKIEYIEDITAVWRKQQNSISRHTDNKKTIEFRFSTFKIKIFFINKFNIKNINIKFLIDEANLLLENAYFYSVKDIGKETFFFLLKRKNVPLKNVKFYIGSQIPFLLKIGRFFKLKIIQIQK